MDPNIQQPVNSQPVQQQIPQPVAKSSSLPKIILSLLAVVIVLGLIGGAYYLGTQKNTDNVPTEKTTVVYPTSAITSIPTNPITPTPDATANWKIYIDPTYHFSFKYPSWSEANTQDNYGIRTEIVTVSSNDRSGQKLTVYLLKNPNNLSTIEFIKQLPAYEGGGFVKPLQNQPSYFTNLDAVVTNGFGGAGNTGSSAYINNKQGGIFQLFTSDLNDSVTNTIFSTFTLSQ